MRAFRAATPQRWRDRPWLLLVSLVAGSACIIGLILAVFYLSSSKDDSPNDDASRSEAVSGPTIDDPTNQEAGSGETSDDPDAGDTTRDVETIADLEQEWARTRAEVVAELTSGGYGVGDDNVLRGPAGFEVNLNDCPAQWSDIEGAEGDSIKIGHTTPLSGTLAVFSKVSTGMEAYFDYVNANGGIDGHQIELIIRDNGYEDSKTIEQVDDLLATEKPFLISTLGTPNSLAVYDTLNDECIPHPFVMNSHPAWGDPEAHPFTSGLQLSSATEALLWGRWIEQNLADQLPVSVRSLYMDNNFGLPYHTSFKHWAEQHPEVISDYVGVSHRQVAPSVADEMATIAADQPDVFISMTAARPCLLAIQEAGALGMTETAAALFTPSGCRDPEAYLLPAGDVADGWHIVGGGTLSATDPQLADDPYISFVNQTLDRAGLDTSVGLYSTGFAQFGWAHVEALRIAAELPGGLTRSNLVLATHAMTLKHPFYLDGISFSVNGNQDGYFIEGSEFLTFDASSGAWAQDGPPVDLNGATPNCSWSDGACR